MRRTVLALLALLCAGLALPSRHRAGGRLERRRAQGLRRHRRGPGARARLHQPGHRHRRRHRPGRQARRNPRPASPGANGMTLNDDGSELYIALTGADAIAQVDTADPFAAGAVTTFPTGAEHLPARRRLRRGPGLVRRHLRRPVGQRPAARPGHRHHLRHRATTWRTTRGSLRARPCRTRSSPATSGRPRRSSTSTRSPAARPRPSRADPRGTSTAVPRVRRDRRRQPGRHRRPPGLLDHRPLAAPTATGSPHSTSAVAMRTSDDLIAFGSTDGVVLYRHGATTPHGHLQLRRPGRRGRRRRPGVRRQHALRRHLRQPVRPALRAAGDHAAEPATGGRLGRRQRWALPVRQEGDGDRDPARPQVQLPRSSCTPPRPTESSTSSSAAAPTATAGCRCGWR